MRLDKFLSNLQYGTRKDIKDMCRDKRIFVNDKLEKNYGRKIDPATDIVKLDGNIIENKGIVYVMLNKPQGYISATKDGMHKTVIDLLDESYQRLNLAIAGRLDIDTEGLVILSNNGEFVHKITAPNKVVDKVYYVKLRDDFEDFYFEKFKEGFEINNGKNEAFTTKPAKLEKISSNECYITISEGKYHQVKRMFIHVGNEVVFLKRTQVGNLKLGDLALGEYREFDLDEIM